ncbi:hypothetical protein GCM10010275_50020 [Streptomyces litmocidini]|uniref:hypothetical protein n=1 Tax=Streptomyces litmocidini TaxID=67318 RepID=UPI00167DAAE0|nr:hypothetical protein [Streptomyces litmocidini]GGV04538.1 hypothetical protein GCM10010275_50020 [Streptomyces litmocidini]
MGALFGYYAAADDEDAVRAVVREDGQPTGTGYDSFVVKGVDPVVELLPAEVLITGRAADAVEADPRRGHLVGMVGDGEVVSLSLTDSFCDSLARFERAQLGEVARAWSASGVFDTRSDPNGLTGFLEELAALVGRAAARGHRLYCWISM